MLATLQVVQLYLCARPLNTVVEWQDVWFSRCYWLLFALRQSNQVFEFPLLNVNIFSCSFNSKFTIDFVFFFFSLICVDGSCSMKLSKQIPRNEPVYLVQKSKNHLELFDPSGETSEIDDKLMLFCPGNRNTLAKTNVNLVDVPCTSSFSAELHRTNCTKQVTGDLRTTTHQCHLNRRNGLIYEAGFFVDSNFVKLYDICYDSAKASALYTHHQINGRAIKCKYIRWIAYSMWGKLAVPKFSNSDTLILHVRQTPSEKIIVWISKRPEYQSEQPLNSVSGSNRKSVIFKNCWVGVRHILRTIHFCHAAICRRMPILYFPVANSQRISMRMCAHNFSLSMAVIGCALKWRPDVLPNRRPPMSTSTPAPMANWSCQVPTVIWFRST